MQLIDVYGLWCAPSVLYLLLKEREPHESISHKAMPSWMEHTAFVERRPYAHWYVLDVDGSAVGAVYLTHQREIGIGILKAHRGKGYAEEGIRLLLEQHPGRALANINPANGASLQWFAKLGFKGPTQVTLERAC